MRANEKHVDKFLEGDWLVDGICRLRFRELNFLFRWAIKIKVSRLIDVIYVCACSCCMRLGLAIVEIF